MPLLLGYSVLPTLMADIPNPTPQYDVGSRGGSIREPTLPVLLQAYFRCHGKLPPNEAMQIRAVNACGYAWKNLPCLSTRYLLRCRSNAFPPVMPGFSQT
ncbi:hypothetical protein BDW67DRAFT_159142 [Aspergillus spinulosporus]